MIINGIEGTNYTKVNGAAMKLKIFSGLMTLIIAFLIYVYFSPSEFTVTREIRIQARPEVIYPFLANSKVTNDWMPWKEIDPNVKMTFSGPDAEVGSSASWESEGQMGVGKAVVSEVVPNQKVVTQITYTKPMEFSQISEFLLIPEGDSTIMRWTVSGHKIFISRLMCMFMDLDKYLGGEFEKGLKKLKSTVEESR